MANWSSTWSILGERNIAFGRLDVILVSIALCARSSLFRRRVGVLCDIGRRITGEGAVMW